MLQCWTGETIYSMDQMDQMLARSCCGHLQAHHLGQLTGLNPEAYLRKLLGLTADHPINRI